MPANLFARPGWRPSQIYGSWVWNCYYGAFNDYLAEIGDRELSMNSFTSDFHRWRSERKKQAQFLILASPVAPLDERWNALTEIPYRSFLLQAKRSVCGEKRGPLEPWLEANDE